MAKPFIKWVGGKRQLLQYILPKLPAACNTYYEPFLGGGAVFFALQAEGRFEAAVLNDWNSELVNTYQEVRDKPDRLLGILRELKDAYDAAPKETFLAYRNPDDELDAKLLTHTHWAARFIFLNRTAFNGLYRLNKKGEFNAPWGKYVNPPICDEPTIRAASEALKVATIRNGDFEDVCKTAKEGDVVYFDPPYAPVNPTSNFTSYTSAGFTIEDQKRLARLFDELVDRGVHVVLSNSDVPVVHDLYAKHEIHVIPARRNINSKGDKRGPVGEVLVVGRRA